MKKMWPLALIGALTAGLAAGCSNANENGNENAAPSAASSASGAAQSIKLKMTVLPDDQKAFQTVFAEYQKDHPDVELEVDTIPSDQYYDKLRLQLSSGEDIDIFGGTMDIFQDTDAMEPLDDYIAKSKMDVSGYGPLYDNLKVDGVTYGLPYRKSNWMLYYNKTLFDKMNVPYPSDDMTWAEFRELAKKMTKGEGADKVYGAFLQPWAQTWYMSAVQTGASIIDKDLSPFKDALQFRMDLEKDGSIMSWAEQISTSAHYNSAFQKGNVAMNLIGDWHVAQLRQAEQEGKIDFDWDVVPVPHPEGVAKNTSLATPVSLMLNKNSKNKEAAFELIRYMAGEQGAKQFASMGYLTGFANDEIRQAYVGDGTLKPKNIHYFVEQQEYPEYPLLAGVKNIVVNNIYLQEGELALTGVQTADEAIKRIGERVQKEWADKYAKK